MAEGLLELGDVALPLLVAGGVDPGLDVEAACDGQPFPNRVARRMQNDPYGAAQR